METTYVMIKPDGVQRGLIGEIIGRFEQKGLKLVGLKSIIPSEETARSHYAVHSERPFFPGLIKFVTSGPVVCMAWAGRDAISVARNLIGPTNGSRSIAWYYSRRLWYGYWIQYDPWLGCSRNR